MNNKTNYNDFLLTILLKKSEILIIPSRFKDKKEQRNGKGKNK